MVEVGAFTFDIITLMENAPDTENVVYLDEYPELKKRVWLRRLAQQRALGKTALEPGMTQILPFEAPQGPDGAA